MTFPKEDFWQQRLGSALEGKARTQRGRQEAGSWPCVLGRQQCGRVNLLVSAKPDTVGKAQLIGTPQPATAYILCFKRLIKLTGVPDPNLLKQDQLYFQKLNLLPSVLP